MRVVPYEVRNTKYEVRKSENLEPESQAVALKHAECLPEELRKAYKVKGFYQTFLRNDFLRNDLYSTEDASLWDAFS